MVTVDPEDTLYQGVTPNDAPAIMDALETHVTDARLRCPTEAPFFSRQKKVVLEYSGKLDPEHIEDYLAVDRVALEEFAKAAARRSATRSGR